MGKQGPCYHCGVTSTPLWRNGPPEKPVLCNACGSRWRTKGTLQNYTPLHARAEPDEFEDYRVSMMKTISIKNKEPKVLKRKYDNNIAEYGGVPTDHYPGFFKGFDEDTSNRSSSGSAVSNSESCAQYGCADASDLTGPSQPIVWDAMVPSRKRTCVTRPKPSPVEKLTKDLYAIWHEQQSSCISASSEEELLLDSDKPMVSVEIGHGSVLIRHPSSIALEEESEASSLSIDNKQHALNSRMVAFPGLIEDTGANISSRGIDKIKKPANPKTEQERFRRDKDQLEKLQILARHNSPLCYIDLQDILNLDTFASRLTNEEQQQLLKFLPSIDTSEPPDRDSFSIFSPRSMFNSLQFKENLSSFQKLLADGLFDNSFSGLKPGDCRVLQKLVLSNLTKSKWVEKYKIIKDMKGKSLMNDSEVAVFSDATATDSSLTLRKPRDGLNKKLSGAKTIIKSPGGMTMTSSYNEVLQSCDFADDSCEQDLLLDVPSNGSFPQAELLPASSFSAQVSTSSSSAYPYLGRP